MSEMDSDYMNYSEKDKERVEMVVEIYDSVDAVKNRHLNKQKDATDVRSIHTEPLGLNTAWNRCYRLTAVCLLLLCVLLLTAVTVLGIKYNKQNTENNQLQTRYNNLTKEKDQLQLQRDQYHQETSELHSGILRLRTLVGWRLFMASAYHISAEKRSWTESRQECRQKGADLVIINNREEQEFISKLFGTSEAWIGLTDKEKEGEFKWVDGSPLITEFWWDEEPNDFNQNEDCVVTGYPHAKSNMSTWADFSCDSEHFWICEIHILLST